MKSGDYALDIAVIGLGQAGGKLAGEFFRRGYRAVALNTAVADLRALDPSGTSPPLPEDRRLHIGLTGFDGAGCDPSFGRSCVQTHAEAIRRFVANEVQGADIVVLCAGLGGGTGSAVASLAQILSTEGYPMVALTTLPLHAENAIVKVNAVRAVHELSSAPLKGWMIVDNARIDRVFHDAPLADYYTCVNDAIVAPLDSLNRINAQSQLQSVRSFDGEELRKLLLAGGVMNYGVSELRELSEETLNQAVLDGLRSGGLMPGGFEPSTLSYLAIVLEASSYTLSRVPMSLIDKFQEHWRMMSKGGAVQVGIYRTSADQAPTTVRLLAISSTLPSDIQERALEAAQEASTVRSKLQQRIGGLDISVLDGVEIMPTVERRVSLAPAPVRSANGESAMRQPAMPRSAPTTKSPSEMPPAMASMQEGATRASGAPPLPERGEMRMPIPKKRVPPAAVAAPPMMRRPADDAPSQAETGHLSERPQRVPPPMPPKGVPGPELYEQLVDAFLSTGDEEVRRQIAERLENDRFSEHAAVRFYVVQAMSRLDRALFESALVAATEDENESVRDLATQALRL